MHFLGAIGILSTSLVNVCFIALLQFIIISIRIKICMCIVILEFECIKYHMTPNFHSVKIL